MARQTKEQAADKRFQRIYARYKSLQSTIIVTFRRARDEVWTDEQLNHYRNKYIIEFAKVLPKHYQTLLDGAYEILWEMMFRNDLTFCYPHPDTGIFTDSKVLCDAGLAQKLDTDRGCHCWWTGGEYKPFNAGIIKRVKDNAKDSNQK